MSKAIRSVKVYEMYQFGEVRMTGSLKELHEQTGRAMSTIRSLIDKEKNGVKLIEIGKRMQIYAYYDGDELVETGTIDEISERTDIPLQTLYYMMSNASKDRGLSKTLIPIEGETVIVKRTHNAKYAPVHENELIREVRRVKRPTMQVSIDQPVKQTELVINDYHKGLYHSMFKGWA